MSDEQLWADYLDELVKRANDNRHLGPHKFEADPKCSLYCVKCGAEVLGFNHRGQ